MAATSQSDARPGTRPLKVGLVLPFRERQMEGATPRWADILAMAQRAEAIGLDSVWLADHLIFQSEGQTTGAWECWSLLSALAATTRRVELGSLVICTGFRNPALLAKMADTVEEISGGRLILGLGAGWNEVEYRAFGYPFDHRVSRFEEALTIIHALLRTGQVDFAGRYYAARECELRPRGPRPTGPPIMIGTRGERMLGLTARYADLWNVWLAFGRSRPAEIPPLRAQVDAACRAVDREPATLGRTAAVMVDTQGRRTGPTVPVRPGLAPEPLTGAPEELAAGLRAFAAEGISHVQVYAHPDTLEGVEGLAPVLALLDHA